MGYTTKKSLLRKVRDGSEIGWSEFRETYAPLILRRGTDFSLRQDELDELLQRVMLEFFQKDIFHTKYDIDNVPEHLTFRYDSGKGRFRDFLRKVVSHHALKLIHERETAEDLAEHESTLMDPDTEDERWNKEWREHLLTQALSELRTRVEPNTYQAFEQYALHQKSVEETAKFCEMSVSGVYTAKSRCISTLQEIVKDLSAEGKL